MPLQSSGEISLLNIATEFGGTAPHSMSEYYDVADGIPSSGQISFNQFYGASAQTTHGISDYYGTYGVGAFSSSGLSFTLSQAEGTAAVWTISPGIPVSSSVKFFCTNGGNHSSYVIMNQGLSSQVSSSSGVQEPVVSFTGTWTKFTYVYSTSDSGGANMTFKVTQIDGGAQTWTTSGNNVIVTP